MSKLSLSQFKLAFRSVIDPADRIIVVYSGIWTFGHRLGVHPADLPRALLEAMLDVMSPSQTLLLPSYTYAYARTRRYSPGTAMPETGILPIAMLRELQPVRTASALNSFLAVGPESHSLAAIQGETIWGKGSLKAHFEERHARMVVLGLPWKDACGFLHRIEEVCNVPYRYHKTFYGNWVDADGERPWAETMFVRPLELLPVFRWAMVDELLRSRGRVRKADGEIHVESADAADLVQAGTEILADDKLALLTNAEEVNQWIRHHKAAEVEQLRVSEPRALDYASRSAL
jgi:aminoglycoside N3'-acetyltransferase